MLYKVCDHVRAEALGDEFLLYDGARGLVHRVSTVGAPWVRELMSGSAVDVDESVVIELVSAGLLEPLQRAGWSGSRRRMLIVATSATAVGLTTLLLPSAAAAASPAGACSGLVWNADVNPTTLDSNGDGTNDWIVRGGGSFTEGNLDPDFEGSGRTVWTGGQLLDSRPLSDFSNPFNVDMTWKAESGATGTFDALFWVNITRSPGVMAAVYFVLKNPSDASQTLEVWHKPGSSSGTLLNGPSGYTGLPATFLQTRFAFTGTDTLTVTINGVAQTPLTYGFMNSANNDRFATIGIGKMLLDKICISPY